MMKKKKKHTESRIARGNVKVTGRISSDGEVPAGVDAVGSARGLHGGLERGDGLAVVDQGDDVLRARVPRREGVGDVAAEAARVVAHAVAARIGRWCGRDGWAYWAVFLGGRLAFLFFSLKVFSSSFLSLISGFNMIR